MLGEPLQRSFVMSNSVSSHAVGQFVPANISNDFITVIGRVLIAAIFLLSGLSKLAAPSYTVGYIASAGLPFPWVGYAIAVAVEIGGSLALIVGYQTRVAAALLAAFSIAAALAFHNHLADQNQFIHFFKNVAMAGGLLQVVAFGAGRFSLDARRG
jgi:putative oxidoreductase